MTVFIKVVVDVSVLERATAHLKQVLLGVDDASAYSLQLFKKSEQRK